MKMMSLKIPDEIHWKLKRMAMEKETSMSEIIMSFIKKELNDHDGIILKCDQCGTSTTVADLRLTDFNCPHCKQRVRMLKAPK
jgi:hypothetical protein